MLITGRIYWLGEYKEVNNAKRRSPTVILWKQLLKAGIRVDTEVQECEFCFSIPEINAMMPRLAEFFPVQAKSMIPSVGH